MSGSSTDDVIQVTCLFLGYVSWGDRMMMFQLIGYRISAAVDAALTIILFVK